MSLESLNNLVKVGQLKVEPMNELEFSGLLHSAVVRLQDSSNLSLSAESQFDLAYNAAHSLALAALRWHGYRSSNRYIVFQVLPQTLGIGPEIWRVLAKCHDCRNLVEYEGYFEIDEQLLKELHAATKVLLSCVSALK